MSLDEPYKKSPSLKKYVLLLLISSLVTIALIVLLYYIGGYFYYRHIQRKLIKDLTPEQLEHYNKWRTEKITFPEEALEANPFSDSTKKAVKNFRQTWNTYKENAFNLNERFSIAKGENISRIPPVKDIRKALDNKDMEKFYSLLSEKWERKTTGSLELKDLFSEVHNFDPLITAYQDVVLNRDYEIDAFAEGIDPAINQEFPSPDYFAIQTVANLVQLKSLALADRKQYRDAFQYALLNLMASKAHPYSSVISRLIGNGILNLALESLKTVIKNCHDKEILKSALEAQMLVALRPSLIRPNAFQQTDFLGYIRHAGRLGIDVRIQGLTAPELLFEWFRVQEIYKERFVLPYIKDDKEREGIISSRKNMDKIIHYITGEKKPRQNYYNAIEALVASRVLLEIAAPNYMEASTREKYIRTRLNLLILHTDQELEVLDHETIPDQVKDLKPEAKADILQDLFSSDNESIKSEPFYYSIGPDGVDQKGEILYDPTNGTNSQGDIFIPFN